MEKHHKEYDNESPSGPVVAKVKKNNYSDKPLLSFMKQGAAIYAWRHWWLLVILISNTGTYHPHVFVVCPQLGSSLCSAVRVSW